MLGLMQDRPLLISSLINPHDIPFGALYLDRQMPDYPITLPKSWNQDMMAPSVPPAPWRASCPPWSRT